MIRAIIFDCFGVLSTDGWLPFKAKYFGHDPLLLQQATDLNKQSDSGLIDYADYLSKIARLAKLSVEQVAGQIENNVANVDLFDYIMKLKPDYKIGMLSNAANNWLTRLFSDEQLKLFDAIALSYETGFIKPQTGAYKITAERLGVKVNECVLVDDQERYCAGARDLGMSAVCYRGVGQTKDELDKLLSYN